MSSLKEAISDLVNNVGDNTTTSVFDSGDNGIKPQESENQNNMREEEEELLLTEQQVRTIVSKILEEKRTGVRKGEAAAVPTTPSSPSPVSKSALLKSSLLSENFSALGSSSSSSQTQTQQSPQQPSLVVVLLCLFLMYLCFEPFRSLFTLIVRFVQCCVTVAVVSYTYGHSAKLVNLIFNRGKTGKNLVMDNSVVGGTSSPSSPSLLKSERRALIINSQIEETRRLEVTLFGFIASVAFVWFSFGLALELSIVLVAVHVFYHPIYTLYEPVLLGSITFVTAFHIIGELLGKTALVLLCVSAIGLLVKMKPAEERVRTEMIAKLDEYRQLKVKRSSYLSIPNTSPVAITKITSLIKQTVASAKINYQFESRDWGVAIVGTTPTLPHIMVVGLMNYVFVVPLYERKLGRRHEFAFSAFCKEHIGNLLQTTSDLNLDELVSKLGVEWSNMDPSQKYTYLLQAKDAFVDSYILPNSSTSNSGNNKL